MRIVSVNDKAKKLLNAEDKNLTGLNLNQLLASPALSALSANFAVLDKNMPPLRSEIYDGERNKWFETILYAHEDLVTICLRDITEYKQTYQALHESELRFRTMLESVVDGVILIDEHGAILLCNNVIEDLFGYKPSELVGRNISILMDPNDRMNHGDYVQNYIRTGKSKIIGAGREVIGMKRDMSTFPLELGVSKFSLNGRCYFVGTMRDVTQRKENEKEIKQRNAKLEERISRRNNQLKSINRRLEQLALHDHLTGLPNRTLFQKKLRSGIQSADLTEQSLILIIIDLDNFKDINDTLGHHVGDMLLKSVSQRITRQLRTSDTVARLGGDEFAIILMRTDPAGAKTVAENILLSLEPPFEIEGHMLISVKASIGIAVYRDHGDNEALLMKHADVAMYEAKRNNIGFAFYDATSDTHTPDKLSLLSQLRLAVENNELQLYYQPKIDLNKGKCTGVEALLRWHHKEKGMIPPDIFVPLAEQTGLIKPLTYWVLNTAMSQYANWSKLGLDIAIAVNLSAKNLDDDDLPDMIAKKLEYWSVPAEDLILEITETSIISDPAKALEVLTRLDDMGITLSIDDYGTGYSSLAYIKKLPVDEIKIDRSFVANIILNHEDAVIVKSTIDLAHALGMRIVAEGVEDKETAERLRLLNCDYVQGYYFSRPLPVDQVTSWFLQSVHHIKQAELV
jgi:diguanylate cyclase (GGDEF)-like protein/PAS domain S-box-containing protein